MRVMYVLPGLGGGGGAERSLAAMVPFWTDRIDVHIVTFSARDALIDGLTRAGAEVTNLGPRGRVGLARELTATIRRSRPDLVHTTLFDADLAGRLAAVVTRTPVSCSLVNVNYGPEQAHMPGVKQRSLRAAQLADAFSARAVSRFHALTDHVADVMSRRLLVRRSKIDVIPRGRDAALLGRRTPASRAILRASLGLGEEPLIVAAARHEWQKGLDVLIRAAPRVLRALPDARFLIAGRDGSQTARLHSLVAERALADRVRFIGPRDDVPDLMCAADVFCVPSRWEGFGSILVEAMAVGVPTVSTEIGAILEVAGPNPWLRLARPADPRSLAQAILASIADPDSFVKLTNLGQARFRQFYQVEGVADRMAEFFARSVQEPH